MRALLLSGCLALVLLTQQAAAQTLLVVGDSISAALGLDTSQGWVALLQKRLADEGYDYRVVNARSAATPPRAAWRACRRCLPRRSRRWW